jgi:hypothetical protein
MLSVINQSNSNWNHAQQSIPTTITILPNFAADKVLFIGTATGNLLTITANERQVSNIVT